MICEKKKKKPRRTRYGFAALILLLLVPLLGEEVTIVGQKRMRETLVTWTTSGHTKTRLLFQGNSVFLDTSATGQTNLFKRIDNTADSCSNPFFISSDSLGGSYPVWQYRLWQVTRAVDADSSTHVFRIQTRKVRSYTNRTINYGPWTIKGANGGYTDVTVQDSIIMPNIRVTTKAAQYALGFIEGIQARLCPDDIAATANAAGDSVFADSLQFQVR